MTYSLYSTHSCEVIQLLLIIKLQQKINVKLPIPGITSGNNFGNNKWRKKELLEKIIGNFKAYYAHPYRYNCFSYLQLCNMQGSYNAIWMFDIGGHPELWVEDRDDHNTFAVAVIITEYIAWHVFKL